MVSMHRLWTHFFHLKLLWSGVAMEDCSWQLWPGPLIWPSWSSHGWIHLCWLASWWPWSQWHPWSWWPWRSGAPWACLGWHQPSGGHLLGWNPSMVPCSWCSVEAGKASTSTPMTSCNSGTSLPLMGLEVAPWHPCPSWA